MVSEMCYRGPVSDQSELLQSRYPGDFNLFSPLLFSNLILKVFRPASLAERKQRIFRPRQLEDFTSLGSLSDWMEKISSDGKGHCAKAFTSPTTSWYLASTSYPILELNPDHSQTILPTAVDDLVDVLQFVILFSMGFTT